MYLNEYAKVLNEKNENKCILTVMKQISVLMKVYFLVMTSKRCTTLNHFAEMYHIHHLTTCTTRTNLQVVSTCIGPGQPFIQSPPMPPSCLDPT